MNAFESVRFGGVELKNRFLLAPIKTALNQPAGRVTPEAERFYRRIAEGGTALLILEPAAVSPTGVEHPKQLRLHSDEHVAELTKLVNAAHEGGGLAAVHLNHAGRAANPKVIGRAPLAPSPMLCPSTGATAEELSAEEIESIIADFEATASRAVATGADFIEVQCGHGYLVSQFLSARTNRRTDEWGRDDAGRLRFATEVLRRVTIAAGSTPVIARISGKEFVEGGLEPRNQAGLLHLLEETGVCAVHVGQGNACDNPAWYFGHMSLPEKPQYDVLQAIRSLTHLPIIAAGRMGYPERIETVLGESMADFIALGRPLLADPDFPAKFARGETDSILECGACLQACLRHVKSGEPIACQANPWVTTPEPSPTSKPRKVLVVGGGPAGIAAALTAARRGHEVALYERNGVLGGQFALGVKAPGKSSMSRVLNGMVRRLRSSGVDIHLNHEVSSVLTAQKKPDVLVLATGAVQRVPDIEGLSSRYVMTSYDFFDGTKNIKGPRVLVIGAGMVGVEVAESLLAEGMSVVATKRSDTIASDMDPITRKLVMKRIGENPDLKLMPSTRVEAFTTEGTRALCGGKEVDLGQFDTVVICSGMEPDHALNDALTCYEGDVHVIGDAAEPANIEAAFAQGLSIGNRI